MHYKNGREAKPGDKVIDVQNGHTGILHSVNAESPTCNGRLALSGPGDMYVTLAACLHIDDVAKADIPDSSKQ